MVLIDGKEAAKQIKGQLYETTKKLIDDGERTPHLAAVIVGNDGASKTYVESIRKNATEVGFTCSVYNYPDNLKKEEFIEVLQFLNNDPEVDGYIVQLPLPAHLQEVNLIDYIDYRKDIDSFHPINMGRLMLEEEAFLPATPNAVMELIKHYKIQIKGKRCVVLGRSNIVGKPLAMLLAQKGEYANGTVTLCHSQTENLQQICAEADILFVAIGKPEFITQEYVKQGATVFDVGIHRIPDQSAKGYRICGDVKYDEVSPKCTAITPVPGGVGSMTIACLLLNTYKAFQNNQ